MKKNMFGTPATSEIPINFMRKYIGLRTVALHNAHKIINNC